MSHKKSAALDWNHLTDHPTVVLEAYFSLWQTREPSTIGSGEILRWFREHDRNPLSEVLIRTLLADTEAPLPTFARRSPGSGAPPPLAAQVETVLLPAHFAGAEPLLTGRTRAYDKRTRLRQSHENNGY